MNLDDAWLGDYLASEVAHLNPGLLFLWFNSDLLTSPGSGSEFSRIPTPLLVHELAHLLQMTATSSGIRWFIDSRLHLGVYAAAVAAAAREGRGLVRPGHAGPGPQGRIAWAVEMLSAIRFGGMRAPVSALRASPRCRAVGERVIAQPFGDGDEMVGDLFWFDLTGQQFGADRAVLLGARHLYEALSASAELHAYYKAGEHPAGARHPYEPFETYGVLPHLYRTFTTGAETRELALAEMLATFDAALMMDDWLINPSPHKPHEPPRSYPMNNFMRMLRSLSHPSDSPRLRDTSPSELIRFQDELLAGAGAPVPSVERLTEAAEASIGPLIGRLRDETTLPRMFLNKIEETFRTSLRFRRTAYRGACPFVVLGAVDRTALEALARTSTGVRMGAYAFQEDAGLDGQYTAPLLMLEHMSPVLHELLRGPLTCPVRHECVLVARPACDGVTSDLTPAGTRCMRELTIHTAMRDLGIRRIERG